MTSEVAYNLQFELIDLDYICSHVSMACIYHYSQDVTTCYLLLLPFLKPCQDHPLTSEQR